MPYTVISHVNELACNEQNQFIFTQRRGCNIGDVDITGVDSDNDHSNEYQAPQDPPRKSQATEETGEDSVIPDTKIDLDINHEAPIEEVKTEKPPEYPMIVVVQPQMTETNKPHQPISVVCRSSRGITHTKSYTPSMSGNRYAYAAA